MTHSPSSAQSVDVTRELALADHGLETLPDRTAFRNGWNARAAASAQATVRPTPISISTEKICEVAKKYNLGNPRLDALRGFVNEIIIVNGAEYAKSE